MPRDQVTLNTGSPLDGVEVANLSPAVKEEYGLNVEGDGVVVLDVKGRSFARRLGLRPGDVIVEVNDASVASVRDLLEWQASASAAGASSSVGAIKCMC